jgi:uncharacterized protein
MTSVREKCREFVEKQCAGYDGSHDISHIDRVVQNALAILKQSDENTKNVIDEDTIVAIASLHDSFDHKYLITEEAVQKAKREVGEFLASACGFSDDSIKMVISVIDNMGYTAEVTGEASTLDPTSTAYLHIVQDADRLDAMGAVGVARCFAFSGAFGRPIISPDAKDERTQRERFKLGQLQPVARKGGSAIAIFYDKLVFLKNMLKTAAGHEIGEQRHQFILQFLDQFFAEIGA